jgi:hypothetical protein
MTKIPKKIWNKYRIDYWVVSHPNLGVSGQSLDVNPQGAVQQFLEAMVDGDKIESDYSWDDWEAQGWQVEKVEVYRSGHTARVVQDSSGSVRLHDCLLSLNTTRCGKQPR